MIGHLDSISEKTNKKIDIITAYLLGITFFLLTLIVKLVLDPYVQFKGVPYLFAFIAVVLTASYGGIMPGVFTTILTSFATDYLFAEPGMNLNAFFNETNILRILAFVTEGSLISFLVGRIKNMKEQAVKTSEISIKNEQYLRGVLDSLFVFVGVTSTKGILIETNRASIEEAGLQFQDVIGKNIVNSYWWSFSKVSKDKLKQSILEANTGKITRCDTFMRTKDGKLINVDFSIAPLKNSEGEIESLGGLME
jgi:PAS domain S-box-containing protein